MGCSYGSAGACVGAAELAVNHQLTDWQTARGYVEKGCAMGHTPNAGYACGYLGMMHWLGFLGGPVDADLALSLFERGCDLKDPISCLWGANISNMIEIADYENALKLSSRACAMANQIESGAGCDYLGDLYLMGDMHSGDGTAYSNPDHASAMKYFDMACRRQYLDACAKAIGAQIHSGANDERSVTEWINLACVNRGFSEDSLYCFRALQTIADLPAPISELGVDFQALIEQLKENCLNKGSDYCIGLSTVYERYLDKPDLEAARFFAQRACDLSTCYALEHHYIAHGSGTEQADMTAFYLRRVLVYGSAIYREEDLGALLKDKDHLSAAIKLLQTELGLPPDGKFKPSLLAANRNAPPM